MKFLIVPIFGLILAWVATSNETSLIVPVAILTVTTIVGAIHLSVDMILNHIEAVEKNLIQILERHRSENETGLAEINDKLSQIRSRGGMGG